MRLIRLAEADPSNVSSYVALLQAHDEAVDPISVQVLPRAVRTIVDQIQDAAHHDGDFYQTLVSYVHPLGGVRYVTTYTASSVDLRKSAQGGRTGRLAAATVQPFTVETRVFRYTSRYRVLPEQRPLFDAATDEAHDAGGELPPVTEAMGRECQRITLAVVDFLARVQGVIASKLVCEFVQNHARRLFFHNVVEVAVAEAPECAADHSYATRVAAPDEDLGGHGHAAALSLKTHYAEETKSSADPDDGHGHAGHHGHAPHSPRSEQFGRPSSSLEAARRPPPGGQQLGRPSSARPAPSALEREAAEARKRGSGRWPSPSPSRPASAAYYEAGGGHGVSNPGPLSPFHAGGERESLPAHGGLSPRGDTSSPRRDGAPSPLFKSIPREIVMQGKRAKPTLAQGQQQQQSLDLDDEYSTSISSFGALIEDVNLEHNHDRSHERTARMSRYLASESQSEAAERLSKGYSSLPVQLPHSARSKAGATDSSRAGFLIQHWRHAARQAQAEILRLNQELQEKAFEWQRKEEDAEQRLAQQVDRTNRIGSDHSQLARDKAAVEARFEEHKELMAKEAHTLREINNQLTMKEAQQDKHIDALNINMALANETIESLQQQHKQRMVLVHELKEENERLLQAKNLAVSKLETAKRVRDELLAKLEAEEKIMRALAQQVDLMSSWEHFDDMMAVYQKMSSLSKTESTRLRELEALKSVITKYTNDKSWREKKLAVAAELRTGMMMSTINDAASSRAAAGRKRL
jgi:hypothetical protein